MEIDKKSHIFAHFVNNETCKALSTVLKIVLKEFDSVSTLFKLKLKEAMHIIWKKPSLNKQQKYVNVSVTV